MTFISNKRPKTNSVFHSTQLGFTTWYIALGVFVIALFFGGWLLWRVNATAHRISLDNNTTSPWQTLSQLTTPEKNPSETLHHDDQGIINILLLGIAGVHQPGNLLTDTIIVLRLDTVNHRVGLLSIPRDLFVPIGDSTSPSTKINALYPIGNNEGKGVAYTEQAVSLVTGLPIHYFVVANFNGFQQVVDAIGGVSIYVERDLYDARYPGPNYSYEIFSITQGWQTLDGATALKYARERHNDPEGDFGRAKRQQVILQAVREKILSAKTLANPFAMNQLLNALGDNVRTNIAQDEIPAFLEVARTLDTHTIPTAVIDAWKPDSILRVVHIPTDSGVAMFALTPRTGNWNETRDLASNIFDLDILKRHQSAIATEQPKIDIINRSGHTDYGDRLRQLLTTQLGFTNVQTIPDPSKAAAQDQSVIYDYTNGVKPWSLDSLIKKFPFTLNPSTDQSPLSNSKSSTTTNTSSSKNTPDFLLVLGSNMQSVFQYQEASKEEYQQQADTMDNNN
ncbi:MAG: LCP family protein [Candidatus Moraniibacteriota bacterium]